MRLTDPLILGAGPAGCAAAITLARAGTMPTLIDRDAEVGDAICGGFLSWKTARQLRALGIEPAGLGAHQLAKVRLFDGGRMTEIPLPGTAWGLSRRRLDNAMRQAACAAGARLVIDTARHVDGTRLETRAGTLQGQSLFLASGKHDVRGAGRPREQSAPATGLRIRMQASAEQAALLSGAIELHMFDGGYAGIVMQECGSINLCLAVSKARLSSSGGKPETLLEQLAEQSPALAARMAQDWRRAHCDTIGAVPYGYVARDTQHGVFRLGDQAAVIPSLAGEGISIALASGYRAAGNWLQHGAAGAPAFQRDFARLVRKPMRMAAFARQIAESARGRHLAIATAVRFPAILGFLLESTRIPAPTSLAPASVAAKTPAHIR